tara:strand:+ start:911 stop:1102 length:192 start_codon:yes stop_codon:yes gene_type:complete
MKIIKIAKGIYRTEKPNTRGEFYAVIKLYDAWQVVKQQENFDDEFVMTADTKKEALEILKINY